MNSEIFQIISNCEWYKSFFLIISDNVFSPLLYYSYFGAAIPSILIVLLILLAGRKKLENRLLSYTIGFFVLWMFGNLVVWATEFPKYTMFYWTLINTVEPFVYFFAFYFSYVFFFKKDFSLLQKIIFSIPLLPTIILAPTKLNLIGYDLTNCDRNAYEGILASYGYLIEILFTLLIVVISVLAVKKAKDRIQKTEIILVTLGVVLFLLSFSLGNILEVFTENWYIGQYGLFGAPVFMALLAFVIVRYKAFDIKLLGAQALVWGLVILISSQFFFIKTTINKILVSITLILSSITGLMIIRGVKTEIAQREDLQKANENQQLLIRFITHQVKGFFTKSKMVFASLLEGDFGEVPETVKPILRDGLESDNRAVDMVQEVLNASSLRTGNMNFNFESINLSSLVQEIYQSFNSFAKDKKLNYEIDIERPDITVLADKTHITQVFKNLIDNALKYTPQGLVKINLKTNQNKILFIIKDSGVGLSDKDKLILFKEGGRGEDSIKYNVNSTGYGLFIVKKIVESHNGRIWAESSGRGQGTTFYVELPLKA